MKPNDSACRSLRGRVHRQVVEVGEDGLLGNALHARDAGQAQVHRALKGVGEPGAHEVRGLLAESSQVALGDGTVVFIDEDDGLAAVVLVQEAGEPRERALELLVASLAAGEALEHGTLVCEQQGAVVEIPMTGVFRRHGPRDPSTHLLPACAVRRAEREVDDGVRALLGAVVLVFTPYREVLEELALAGDESTGLAAA